eukprot:365042-Chlamydomonas_euryale.AAC.2
MQKQAVSAGRRAWAVYARMQEEAASAGLQGRAVCADTQEKVASALGCRPGRSAQRHKKKWPVLWVAGPGVLRKDARRGGQCSGRQARAVHTRTQEEARRSVLERMSGQTVLEPTGISAPPFNPRMHLESALAHRPYVPLLAPVRIDSALAPAAGHVRACMRYQRSQAFVPHLLLPTSPCRRAIQAPHPSHPTPSAAHLHRRQVLQGQRLQFIVAVGGGHPGGAARRICTAALKPDAGIQLTLELAVLARSTARRAAAFHTQQWFTHVLRACAHIPAGRTA